MTPDPKSPTPDAPQPGSQVSEEAKHQARSLLQTLHAYWRATEGNSIPYATDFAFMEADVKLITLGIDQATAQLRAEVERLNRELEQQKQATVAALRTITQLYEDARTPSAREVLLREAVESTVAKIETRQSHALMSSHPILKSALDSSQDISAFEVVRKDRLEELENDRFDRQWYPVSEMMPLNRREGGETDWVVAAWVKDGKVTATRTVHCGKGGLWWLTPDTPAKTAPQYWRELPKLRIAATQEGDRKP